VETGSHTKSVYEGRDRATGRLAWTGARVDVVFGANSQPRAISEVYASADAAEKLVELRHRARP